MTQFKQFFIQKIHFCLLKFRCILISLSEDKLYILKMVIYGTHTQNCIPQEC